MRMNNRYLWLSYAGLLALITFYLWTKKWYVGTIVTLYLVFTPLVLGQKLRYRLSFVEFLQSVMLSSIILIVAGFFLFIMGAHFEFPLLKRILFHFFIAAIPEETYFRGFLQERLGNNLKAILLVSILFVLAHIPRMVFASDPSSLLTFFPSIVMGLIYYKTGNLLYPVIFHALSNLLMESARGYHIPW